MKGLISGAVLAMLLGGCAGRLSRYTGPGLSCGAGPSRATLVTKGSGAVLTPDDGSIVLRGTVTPAGAVTMAWTPQTRGVPRPGTSASASGRVDRQAAHLSLVMPGCSGRLELTHPDG